MLYYTAQMAANFHHKYQMQNFCKRFCQKHFLMVQSIHHKLELIFSFAIYVGSPMPWPKIQMPHKKIPAQTYYTVTYTEWKNIMLN